jgi:hypothetical protein
MPAGGSNQWTPKASQANSIDASAGIAPFAGACAEAPAANVAKPAPSTTVAALADNVVGDRK